MTTLIADRFLWSAGQRTIDLATGEIVSTRISRTGDRIEQQAWTRSRAAILGLPRARTLIDFGLLGGGQRFETFRSLKGPVGSYSIADRWNPSRPFTLIVEWLEDPARSAPRILCATGGDRRWVEPLAREIRMRGFIPVNLSLLDGGGTALPLPARAHFSGRAVVVLCAHSGAGTDTRVSTAFVTLLTAHARDIAAVVFERPTTSHELELDRWSPHDTTGSSVRASQRMVARASESRGAYGESQRVPPISDSRAQSWLAQGRTWSNCGRHAAAARALRAAIAAFDRRRDLLRAGESEMALGRLLLARGRAADARSHFDAARDRFQRLGAANLAVNACVLAGLAFTDDGALEQAETTLRAAYSAAGAVSGNEMVEVAKVALARNEYWRGRYADALALLGQAGLEKSVGVRRRCLAGRIHLATGNLDGAFQSLRQARAVPFAGAADETTIRLMHARIQAKLGDVDALECHVRAGLEAARSAHLPLAAVKLRMALIEGLLNSGQLARARLIGRCTKRIERAPLPRLLKQQVEGIIGRLSRGESGPTKEPPVSAVHEAASFFASGHIDPLTELLSACHDTEDERAALTVAAVSVRKHSGALASAVFGAIGSDAAPLGAAGTISSSVATRCIDLTYAITPDRESSGVEAAVPIQHLGRTIGAIACRWSLQGPSDEGRALGYMRLAAAACAPFVQIVLAHDSRQIEKVPIVGAELVGSSTGIEEVRRLIVRAASAPFAVLIEGESGSGKELVARAIHYTGSRRERPFCALNCAALTEELVDTELFGHVKGAFTGAAGDRLGLFESADQGTVFLDEVGELSPRAQAKLLRVLQEGEIRRIGENFTRPIDMRLVAATNRPLRTEVEDGRFRRDLLYRLDVIRIPVPPLRERIDDIPVLAARFWRLATERIGSKAVLGHAALSALARYDWPGNVRELQNVLTALAVSSPPRGIVSAAALPAAIAHAASIGIHETLDTARRRFDERFVRAALAQAAGHRGRTAAALGVSRQGLAKLMQRLRIDRRLESSP